MNVQCKNKKCNKIKNELVQKVIVLAPFKHVVMSLFCGLCVWVKKIDWKRRIHLLCPIDSWRRLVISNDGGICEPISWLSKNNINK